ncbi:Phosphotransferase enzyme family protein [Lachnospiraceae bacterium G41]|nr:Phosphotransferase enzyme family protein [Lachnospiraceae bacterium G41]
MEIIKADQLFENVMKVKVFSIERCNTGIGNYVFIVTAENNKYILRCSLEKDAYENTVYLLKELEVCDIPIPKVIKYGQYEEYRYLILSYLLGEDIGNIYQDLRDSEKRQIAKEVVAIQNKVSALKIQAPDDWNWNSFADEMLGRAHELISKNGFFDVSKVEEVSNILKEMQPYISSVKPIPYLDDISTKNLLIENGHVSGVIDIDWMGFGDKLTFVAMTEVALLNMNLYTNYVDYLLEEMNLNSEQKRAFIFYCLLFCVDFMGERGTQYLDKVVPVNQEIIDRLNSIYDCFMNQWKYYKGVPF